MAYKTQGDEFMSENKVSKEELLHIAKLADLNLKEDETEKYLENLQEILNFADVINNADVSNLDALLQNAPEKEQNMFKIPKVIN